MLWNYQHTIDYAQPETSGPGKPSLVGNGQLFGPWSASSLIQRRLINNTTRWEEAFSSPINFLCSTNFAVIGANTSRFMADAITINANGPIVVRKRSILTESCQTQFSPTRPGAVSAIATASAVCNRKYIGHIEACKTRNCARGKAR